MTVDVLEVCGHAHTCARTHTRVRARSYATNNQIILLSNVFFKNFF